MRAHRYAQALAGTALGLTGTALFGGAVSGEYVGASVFDLLVPMLVGIACGLVAARGARSLSTPAAAVLAAAYAVLSAAYGFHFSRTAMASFAQAGPPLILGGAAAAITSVWSARPPTRPRRAAGGRGVGGDPADPAGS